MRILLTHHFPVALGNVGRYVADLAQALQAGGHEVRMIAVGDGTPLTTVALRIVSCLQQDSQSYLPFDVPWFGIEPEGPRTFEQLTSDELATYRNVLRRDLDAEVEAFDPQIIHAQHVWLWGQLALESGVPYVLSAWGPELVARARDDRYRPFADQAAENAGRIFVPDEHVRREVLNSFDDVAERTVLLPDSVDADVITALAAHYQTVLDDRFGMMQ
jgi:hypothetical protein